jgi:hypothetical protein
MICEFPWKTTRKGQLGEAIYVVKLGGDTREAGRPVSLVKFKFYSDLKQVERRMYMYIKN